MRGHALRHRLLLVAALFCVGSCLSTEGYYRFQDGGATGSGGETGTAGNNGRGGGAGAMGNAGTGGAAGSIATGRGGTTGTAGTTGAGGTTAGRGGTTGSAGRGGTTGSAGRGGTTGSAGSGATTGGGGSGAVLFMDDFEAGSSKWDIALNATHSLMADGSQVLNLSETAGDQALAAAGMPSWTNYSVEVKVKVLSFTGTSSSDGVAICARLSGVDSFYYLLISPSDTKALKIKLNNGSNTSLSSSLDSTGFAVNTWVTLRLDLQGNTLTASLNGTIRGTYTAVDADKILPMGGIGLMVQRANAVFDDVTVRALP